MDQNIDHVVAAPNAQELEWAFEAAMSVQEQGQSDQEETIDQSMTTTSASKKKKKNKLSKLRKKLTGNGDGDNDSAEAGPSRVNQETFQLRDAIKQKLESEHGKEAADKLSEKLTPDVIQQIMQLSQRNSENTNVEPAKPASDKHKFWSTQPVPKFEDKTVHGREEGAIEPDTPHQEIRQDPYPLPDSFEWCTVDLNDQMQLQEVYELLTMHYVEDDSASFRFDYIAEFIRWALQPPGYIQDWHIGVRVSSNNKLVGFIAGIPCHLRLRNNAKRISEINFLCVHKKLRNKRLAPVLIKEVTRRCHLRGIFQAVYTGGVYLPTPISTCQYYHRILNVKKLVEVGFTGVPRSKTLAGMIKDNAVPAAPALAGFREMQEADCPAVANLLRSYLARFDLAPIFDAAEFKHYFYSGQGTGEPTSGRRKEQVTWAYVVEDPTTHKITDFFSFYHLPSTAIKHKQTIDAAYAFYYATSAAPGCSSSNAADSDTTYRPWDQESPAERLALKKRLNALARDALVIAKQANFDVFNALTLLDDSLFIHQQNFGPGDGKLHFYLYNWLGRPINGGTIGSSSTDSEEVVVSAAPPGMDVREVGSGVGLVML